MFAGAGSLVVGIVMGPAALDVVPHADTLRMLGRLGLYAMVVESSSKGGILAAGCFPFPSSGFPCLSLLRCRAAVVPCRAGIAELQCRPCCFSASHCCCAGPTRSCPVHSGGLAVSIEFSRFRQVLWLSLGAAAAGLVSAAL